MDSRPQSSFPNTLDIQTVQPRLSPHGPVVLLILLGSFALFFLLKHDINRIVYCSFSLLVIAAVLFHFRKEYRLVHDRLVAIGVVTDYGVPFSNAPRFLRFFIRKFSPEVPIAKYSFVAFDQKTYTGQTGWHTHVSYKGAKITVLYKLAKPSVNHPVRSFIFYRFG